MSYPKVPYLVGKDQMVLSTGKLPKEVNVKPNKPGAVIVIHGVNDVGTGFQAVEDGICHGLGNRLGWDADHHPNPFCAATYRMPGKADQGKLFDDPDAVFFKRQLDGNAHSPVIPFYWGYRESGDFSNAVKNGQQVDRFGNRLDKDRSKGGGPFANATSNLPDMWNSGAAARGGALDALAHDPLRPVLGAPGRMYFILAALRLANLVNMIRAYNPQEAVSIVAHSQGCLISLLAQAFLMQEGKPTADTLVLTHPPYSLAEPATGGLGTGGGEDAVMREFYSQISGVQTMRACLDTLINITKGVARQHRSGFTGEDLEHMKKVGVHSTIWEPGRDRPNHGKVYLYFCPEDQTVALMNVQGIGWQGVPNISTGKSTAHSNPLTDQAPITYQRKPLSELGATFKQRVFTAKVRTVGGQSQPFPVGAAPQDFVLRADGEDDHAHVMSESTGITRKHLAKGHDSVRHINGEALQKPVKAEMFGGSLVGDATATPPPVYVSTQRASAPQDAGKLERIDPIDAAIGVTSDYGLRSELKIMDDPRPGRHGTASGQTHMLTPQELKDIQAHLNQGIENPLDQRRVLQANTLPNGQLRVVLQESPNQARLRMQNQVAARSFHGAIFGSRANHANVTAYDLAIGQGWSVSDPRFYAYLCAVADWRLKKPDGTVPRKGIMTWKSFTAEFAPYWSVEPTERRRIIEGSCDYYTTGQLPAWLPTVVNRPPAVVSETTTGRTVQRPRSQP